MKCSRCNREIADDQTYSYQEEVQASFKLSEAEMDEQLTPLQHSELVKEHDEKDAIYLITIA